MVNPQPNFGSNPQSQTSPVSDWINQIGLGFRVLCHRKNIEIAMDLDEVHDIVEAQPVKDAVIAMINNAIESMPNGGDLEITLIDGGHQWEVEVADSGQKVSSFPRDRSFKNETENGDADQSIQLPVVEPILANRHLQNLEQIAFQLSASLQAWKCPLGGMAHVMIVPKSQAMRTGNSNPNTIKTNTNSTLVENERRDAA